MFDQDVRSARVPRALLDVTVRHGVPARGPGAVNRTAELEKRLRYSDGRTPWLVLPFAVESFGRLGPMAPKHLRGLARTRAQALPEGGGGSIFAPGAVCVSLVGGGRSLIIACALSKAC